MHDRRSSAHPRPNTLQMWQRAHLASRPLSWATLSAGAGATQILERAVTGNYQISWAPTHIKFIHLFGALTCNILAAAVYLTGVEFSCVAQKVEVDDRILT